MLHRNAVKPFRQREVNPKWRHPSIQIELAKLRVGRLKRSRRVVFDVAIVSGEVLPRNTNRVALWFLSVNAVQYWLGFDEAAVINRDPVLNDTTRELLMTLETHGDLVQKQINAITGGPITGAHLYEFIMPEEALTADPSVIGVPVEHAPGV